MASSRPAIAVINLPALASVLRGAGFTVIDGDTNAIANAVRDLSTDPPEYVIVIGVKDEMTSTWVKFRSATGAPILVATSDHFNGGTGLPKPTRFVELPCTVDTIMSNFGAPLVDPGGDVVINADGTSDSDECDVHRTEHDLTEVNVASRDGFDVYSVTQPSTITEVVELAAPSSASTLSLNEATANCEDVDSSTSLSCLLCALANNDVAAPIEIAKLSCTYYTHVKEKHSQAHRAVKSHCRQCHREWTGKARAHCAACHETFSTNNTSDLHRSGSGANGHCLDPSKVVDSKGSSKLIQDDDGTWRRIGQRPADLQRTKLRTLKDANTSRSPEGAS
jgi:hypothetical protein